MPAQIDVVVIGAGAAGMMAAGRALESGASVCLLEKTARPGNKVLIAGNRRCNLTNTKDLSEFILMYGPNGRFLYTAFKHFFREDLLALFSRCGVNTTAESDGRVFPASGDARDVVAALERYGIGSGVELHTNTRATEIVEDSGLVRGAKVDQALWTAKAVILATGGSSYPGTGSTGDGYRMAASVGHHIVSLRPSLVALIVEERELVSSLQGLSLSGVRLTSYRCRSDDGTLLMAPASEYGRGLSGGRAPGQVIESRRGELMFTQFGISGPITLQMSLAVVDALEKGPVSVAIDLMPDTDIETVNRRLQSAFDRSGNKEIRNLLREFVPERLARLLPVAAAISESRLCNQVTGRERETLVRHIKALRFNIKSSEPISEAMVTAGGVSLDEIDPRTMGSRLVKGLYFCGEVIDVDAETGGFNLQAAFSTGYLAGQSAASYARITT